MKTTVLFITLDEIIVQTTERAVRHFDYHEISDFYDRVYYRDSINTKTSSFHLRQLARRFEPWAGRWTLDVACGPGSWLQALAERGAKIAGIDISQVALDLCRSALPEAEIYCGPAEQLPFADRQFDFISCLGALEHFLEPEAALQEMIRVAKPDARFLLLVPNADFLPMRLGLYTGTSQATVKEEPRSLLEWQHLFESAGLRVQARWKDLHILSWSWICQGPYHSWALRAAQALALPFWPLTWQYQVYHLCVLNK